MGRGQGIGPQVRAIICSMYSKEAIQSRVGRTRGRVIGDEVREVSGTGPWGALHTILRTLSSFWRKLEADSLFYPE